MKRTIDVPVLPGSKRRNTLYFVPLLTDLSGMLLIFTVSRNLAEIDAGLLRMGLIGAGHATASLITSFIAGSLSDRVGRKQLIVPGVLLLIVSATVCLVSPFGRGLFLSMYWLSAVALGLIHPATVAWLNHGEKKQSFSQGVSRNLIRFCIAWNTGVLAAQFSGGLLFAIGPRFPLILSVAAALLDLVAVLSAGAAPVRTATPAPAGRADDALDTGSPDDSHRESATAVLFVRLSWLANLAGAFAMSMVIHLFPQLAVSLGIPPQQHGTILALMRVLIICIYLVLHRTDFWKYRFTSTLVVQAAAVVGLLFLYFAAGPVSLYIGVTGLALLIGYDYFSGIYYGHAGHGDDRRGFASGMHEASLGLGIAVGSLSGGFAGAYGGERLPYVLAVIVILVFVVAQSALFLRSTRNGVLAGKGARTRV